ncbi:MAG TPA: DNA-formamidopyrimidine glycosylase family protein [Gemmatimonadaceae bacterium]|nr:DNA-formamidopyrimidine glycosylase family protein [Gemmatimonadaceae bacterium]
MPELPDITVYIEALEARVLGKSMTGVRIVNPFVLRSVEPPVQKLVGVPITGFRRMGKRIVMEFEDDLFMVIHLMIAGRLRWRASGGDVVRPAPMARFEFRDGVLVLTEAGKKRRASIHLVQGEKNLDQFDRGGLEVLTASRAAFADRLRSENHTVKRSLTDPTLFSGIGNAYSDEILHRAKLSPLFLTSKMSDEQVTQLFGAVREVLTEWTDKLRADAAGEFPEKVTAFREGMAVHGRFGRPCPVCGAPVQRIRYADNETNYCARCQTGGRLLADRAMSRLLKQDWPRSLDEM